MQPFSCRPAHPTPHRRARGLTLVEAAITLGIVAAVAGAGATAYRGHQERSRNVEAAADIALMGNELDRRWHDTHAYPKSLDEVFPGKRDPWGHPYRYQRLEDSDSTSPPRVDATAAPINSRFDLWSDGANGGSKPPLNVDGSHDDIIWARDGRYVGAARDY